jgi:hypothetical protein
VGEKRKYYRPEKERWYREMCRVCFFSLNLPLLVSSPLSFLHISLATLIGIFISIKHHQLLEKEEGGGGIEKKENENELDGPSRSSGRPLNSENFLILYPLTPYYFVS